MTPADAEKRGLLWVLGAFVICPCHLPLTLWAAAALLSGTAAGALFHAHVFLAGAAISARQLNCMIASFNVHDSCSGVLQGAWSHTRAAARK